MTFNTVGYKVTCNLTVLGIVIANDEKSSFISKD